MWFRWVLRKLIAVVIVSCCDVTQIYWEAYIGLCCNGADMCFFVHGCWIRWYWQRWHWCLMIMAMGGGWFDDAWVTNVDVWHGTWCARNLEWYVQWFCLIVCTFDWLSDWVLMWSWYMCLWKWMIEWCVIRMSAVWHWCRSVTYVIVWGGKNMSESEKGGRFCKKVL